MKSLFSGLTALSLRFRVVTLALVVLLSVAGVYAVTQLKQELIPSVEFPQTIILAQATGMTSDQVLNVLTSRIETALDEQVPDVVNLESSTTGAFGAVITARNNFGVNAPRLRSEIQRAIDSVWLPLRRLAPSEGESATEFAARLLADLPPEVLIYLQTTDSNFLFQLSPDVWSALSPDTVQTLLAYLATQTKDVNSSDALRLLVEQEVVPALQNIEQVASVSVSGGQILPSEGEAAPTPLPVSSAEAPSRLLDLTPEVWAIVSAKVDGLSALDQTAVEALRALPFSVPEGVPALPASWQMDRFKDARDLREMRTLTRTLGAVFNTFVTSGEIVGALGQTDDLTAADINQLLAVEPTLVQYFEADQLVSLSDEAFAALPADYIANLDGLTRDQLAAKALAVAISGAAAQPDPVDLPQPWRISPPQLITFSFDDIPLATFSISGTGAALPAESGAAADGSTEAVEQPADTAETPVVQDIPEGPSLPLVFNLLGGFIGLELNTADDLINIQLPDEMAAQFGGTQTLRAADLLNFLLLLDNPDALPEGAPSVSIPGGAAGVIRQLSPEVITFIATNDPTFLPNLSADVVSAFSLDVLLNVPGVEIPLDTVWDTLSAQPQFATVPLETAQDIVEIGGGQPSTVLNTINANVPEQFAGYEVRLFDSLTPGIINYFNAVEPEFFANLDPAVVAKFAPATLAELSDEVIAALPADTATTVRAIASGETASAATQLAERYATDVPPADPNAPALNADWQFIGDFLGVELDTADDLFRFFPSATGFINGLFNSAQGASFAPNLIGNTSPEAVAYMVTRDPNFLNDLRIEALQLFSADVVSTLPADVQERIASGAAPFVPTNALTRVNGNSSLSVTVYKTDTANNVEAFHIVEDLLHEIDEADDTISVSVAFEQASFVEESISGVAREGGLGAIFAVVVILIFLSSGRWSRRPRAVVGGIMIALFLGGLFLVVQANLPAAGGDFGRAFEQTDVVVRVLLLLGAGAGFLVLLWPGNLPHPAWRSTLVSGVSIPLSVLMALAFMYWVPPIVHNALLPLADTSPLATFFLRLFPESITLNIMTLSGLTVAIGRVVDDSIVVLENIFRHLQEGEDKTHALIEGTRDVSVAIFAATVITVVVFLPLGLTGGIIGEFFLPFGLAVTYSLLSSFIVAITVVPVVAYLLLDRNEIADEENSWLERLYDPALKWALASGRNNLIVLALAAVSLIVGLGLFATRPLAFLPSFGEPQVSVAVNMPAGTKMADTNAVILQFEDYLAENFTEDDITTVSTRIGGGDGFAALILGSSGVSENVATITLSVEHPDTLDALTGEIRTGAEAIFGPENVTVSSASLSEQGFGGFALVLSGEQADLQAINADLVDVLNGVEGLTNVSSNVVSSDAADEGPVTFIRVDLQSAARYTGELETNNTIGVTNTAKQAIQSYLDSNNLADRVTVSEGFESRQQTEGFAGLGIAMGIAIVLVVLILIVTFGSLVHWLDIILSIIVAPVGAAILLTLTNRVLGISAMIGLLMLIGIVVTNAVVLIDRVQSNRRERHMELRDALLEAGERRLRPILMTALATIGALVPLAVGLSEGAIIASELGTVVIGGLFSSTLLTLIVVPVAYRLLDPLHRRLALNRKDRQLSNKVSS